MRRLGLLTLVFAASGVLAACSDSSTGPTADPSEDYELVYLARSKLFGLNVRNMQRDLLMLEVVLPEEEGAIFQNYAAWGEVRSFNRFLNAAYCRASDSRCYVNVTVAARNLVTGAMSDTRQSIRVFSDTIPTVTFSENDFDGR